VEIDAVYRPHQGPGPNPSRRLRSRLARKAAFLIASRLPNHDIAEALASRLMVRPDADISMGRWSYFDGVPAVHRYPGAAEERIKVGAFCSIAKDVQFILGGNHDTRRVTTSPVRKLFGVEDYDTSGEVSGRGDIVIGNDVWIGRGAMILSGANVGDGAVIGAQAVVSGQVAIAVGSPAREVRRRFDPETIDRLLAVGWWDLPDQELLPLVDRLSSRDVSQFLDHLEGRSGVMDREEH
jgi:acetyltransferase-like isoleucine patch superfamily enzyme